MRPSRRCRNRHVKVRPGGTLPGSASRPRHTSAAALLVRASASQGRRPDRLVTSKCTTTRLEGRRDDDMPELTADEIADSNDLGAGLAAASTFPGKTGTVIRRTCCAGARSLLPRFGANGARSSARKESTSGPPTPRSTAVASRRHSDSPASGTADRPRQRTFSPSSSSHRPRGPSHRPPRGSLPTRPTRQPPGTMSPRPTMT